VASDEEEPVLLDLRRTLSRISRARHDINNPLTSGLAEAQLALMDVRDPAVKEALETIEAQFRRIRDLVGGITWLRHAE
jgi:signal transduction histidine kinase